MNMILETERLYLREMNQADFESLCKIISPEALLNPIKGVKVVNG